MCVRLPLAICLFFACAGCRTARIGRSASPPRSDFELGEADQDLSKALANYGKAILAENELGLADKATSEYWDAAAAHDPGRSRLYLKAAALHFHRGEPAEAARILERARDHNPRHAQTHLNLALAYEAMGKLDLALHECRTAARLEPALHSSYVRLAGIYFKQGSDRKGLRALRRGLDKAEDTQQLVDACISYGTQLAVGGSLERGIACFELLARHQPAKAADLYGFIADLYEKQDNTERAVAYLEKATRTRPPQADAFLRLADYYSATTPDRAERILCEALELLPHEPRVHFAIAFMLTVEDRFDEAIGAYRRTEELIDEAEGDLTLNAEFYLYYGMACEQAGRIDEAAAVFLKGITIYPDSHVMLNYLAYMWAEKGLHLDKGLQYVTKALELEPENGAYVDTLGWIYYQKKQYAKALKELVRASELEEDPTIVEHIGDTYSALGEAGKAIEYWKRSFVLDPESESVTGKLNARNIDLEPLHREAEERKKKQEKEEEAKEQE